MKRLLTAIYRHIVWELSLFKNPELRTFWNVKNCRDSIKRKTKEEAAIFLASIIPNKLKYHVAIEGWVKASKDKDATEIRADELVKSFER